MSAPLDLSGADTSGFEALPAGEYDAEIFEAAWTETKGSPGAKYPKGTPMLNVQFRLIGDPVLSIDDEGKEKEMTVENRRAFRTFMIPPEKLDGKKNPNAAKIKGIFVRFLETVGYSKDDIVSGSFELDLEDLKGRVCTVVLGKRAKKDSDGNETGEIENDVKGVKPAKANVGSGLL